MLLTKRDNVKILCLIEVGVIKVIFRTLKLQNYFLQLS